MDDDGDIRALAQRAAARLAGTRLEGLNNERHLAKAKLDAQIARLGPPAPAQADPDGMEDAPPGLEFYARALAALSGPVAPRSLVPGAGSEAASNVLSRIATDFDRLLTPEGWRWTLRDSARRVALAGMAADNTLPDVLEAARSIETNGAGNLLRDLAIGAALPWHDPAQQPPEGGAGQVGDTALPGALVQALSWLKPLGRHDADFQEARRRASLAALRDGHGVLLRHGLVGRAEVLATLNAFARRPSHGTGVPVLTLTGVGGAGKSTVLAEFVRPLLDAAIELRPGPVVVLIDLERSQFRVGLEVELTFELLRQLGAARPDAAAEFAALRRDVREQRRSAGADLVESAGPSEVTSRDFYDISGRAAGLAQAHGLDKAPIVLVLDTLEAWQRQRPVPGVPRDWGNDPEQRIAEWVVGLYLNMGLHGLRVVASGRAEMAMATWLMPEPSSPLFIGDLGEADAAALLERQGVAVDEAAVLARQVGGNPLTLRVAARAFKRLDPAQQSAFLANPAENGAAVDEEVRRAVLYDRFLQHIASADARKLAHPGLVLRRVTAPIIQHVLAPRCGLGQLDDGRAAALLEELKDEVWLVTPTADGLRHSPDVRRPMLRHMVADPAMAEEVRGLHRAAAAWYRDGKDPTFGQDAAATEAAYHELMLQDGAEPLFPLHGPGLDGFGPGSGPLQDAIAALGDAVDDMPPGVRAQLMLLRREDMSDDDVAALPSTLFERWLQDRGGALVASGRLDRALALFDRRRSDAARPTWLAGALMDAGRLDDIGAEDLLEPSVQVLAAVVAIGGNRVWSYASELLKALTGQSDRQLPQGAEPWFAALLLGRGLGPNYAGSILRQDWLKSIVLANPALPAALDKAASVAARAVLADASLRTAIVGAYARHPKLCQVRAGAAADMFRPDPAWVAQVCALAGLEDHPEAVAFTAKLERAKLEDAAPASALVLRTWALGFAKLFEDRKCIVDLPSLERRPELASVLRGTNPEFRPVVRRALAEAATTPWAFRTLGHAAMSCLPLKPDDLQPEVLATDGAARPQETIARLSEYADRSGVLSLFIAAAAGAMPEAGLLQRIKGPLALWDAAHSRLLQAVAASLRLTSPRTMDA